MYLHLFSPSNVNILICIWIKLKVSMVSIRDQGEGFLFFYLTLNPTTTVYNGKLKEKNSEVEMPALIFPRLYIT